MQPALPLDVASTTPPVEVRRSRRRTRTMTAFREGSTIVVCIPAQLSQADEDRYVPELVARVLANERKRRPPHGDAELRARAEQLAREYLEPAAGQLRLPHDVVWVDNQQQRWGSCSPGNATIRLSSRLQAMPSWVVDYVLLHELTHLLEVNHTPRFWELLGAYPQAERARGYLDGYSDATRRGGVQ